MNGQAFRAIGVGAVLLAGLSWPAVGRAAAASSAGPVERVRTPNDGIQPQAVVDARGALHLVYLKGDPRAADIFYARRPPGARRWTAPLRVNNRPGSAVAVGAIRGAQLALGKHNRVHVVWAGSEQALSRAGSDQGMPLLYSRLNDARTAFEPQRNLMQFTTTLDGGPSVAADPLGTVYVAWHAADGVNKGEAKRRLWLTRSTNEGRSFSRAAPADVEPAGACACCSVRAFVDRAGTLSILYRAATRGVDRDMILLTSRDRGRSFQATRVHPWKVETCPMSSASFAEGSAGVLAAWETRGQVHHTRLQPATRQPSRIRAAPGHGRDRKHPALAAGPDGSFLLVWTEGTGWQKGGDLAWQLYDRTGSPLGASGRVAGAIPVWGLATVVPVPAGRFLIIH